MLSEKPAMPKLEYPVILEPLPQGDGGGFVALVPDLPGCMSDGENRPSRPRVCNGRGRRVD
jgi:hypothetical protein